MASIYEKTPLFKLQKMWNERTNLPEVYKVTSPNPTNKNKFEIHKDNGLLGLEWTVDKTIPDFDKACDKLQIDCVTAFIEFENVLEGALALAWKHVLKEHFPEPLEDHMGKLPPWADRTSKESFQKALELFLQRNMHEKKLRDHQLIYYHSGGDFHVLKGLETSPIQHCHHFNELL